MKELDFAEILPTLSSKYNNMSLTQIAQDQSLARIGDTLVNFIFSLAISELAQKGHTVRVRDKDLAFAVRSVGISKLERRKKNVGNLGDLAEAVIAYHFLSATNQEIREKERLGFQETIVWITNRLQFYSREEGDKNQFYKPTDIGFYTPQIPMVLVELLERMIKGI